jgi:uncharacterized protein (TIGR00369 family)
MPERSPSAPQRWRSFAPFYAHLGLDLESIGEGTCVVRLADRREIHNSKDDLHGGAIAALVDIAMSQAVRSTGDDDRPVATVSMTISYLGAAAGGVSADARVVRAGSTLVFAEAVVIDAGGNPIVRASGVYRLMRRAQ